MNLPKTIILLIGLVVLSCCVFFFLPGEKPAANRNLSGKTIPEPVDAAPSIRARTFPQTLIENGDPKKQVRVAEEIQPLEKVKVIHLTPPDRASFDRNVKARQKKQGDGVVRFAESIDVNINPQNWGQWEELSGGISIWRTRINSPGAQSLNLAFMDYEMPKGGKLSIYPSDQEKNRPIREFTEADNEEHRQLWTPIIAGEELVIEVMLPTGKKDLLALQLSKVNHGFRGFKDGKIGGNNSISGSCNVDVACINDPVLGPLIQIYEDPIRSVGAYTLSGTDTCSGALINNTANDGKPYFLTAEHCGISPANAPSMVVYFNFENSNCRQPGSTESGQDGDGDLSQFSSGAILRAENAASDFCLVELDDPIPSAYNVFFSGWDRTGANGPAVGIHHPAIAEKRISFELDDTIDSGATHVQVSDWDHGTTEGGSSGSPLFDLNGRIIGDLSGGNAECGNDLEDRYGRISVSWTGGGTAATRLSDWLDPGAGGSVAIDGINQNDTLSIDDLQISEGDSGSTTLDFTVSLDRFSSKTVTVQYQSFDGTATTDDSDYTVANGTLSFGPAEFSKTISVTINGDSSLEENETFEVRLSNPTNAIIVDGIGTGTINNDDFILPVITSSLTENGIVGRAFSYQIEANNTPTSYSISNEPTGMTVNSSTGLISWVPQSSGPSTVTLTASNPAGQDDELLTINVAVNPLETALDVTSIGFSESSTKWFLQTTEAHDTVDAAKSPALAHNESSWFETEITTSANGDIISFWWKVSSEDDFDFLTFSAEGIVVEEISGEVDWTEVNYYLPANTTTTLRWEYAKDAFTIAGLDAGFVDEIALASDDPLPSFYSSTLHRSEVDELFDFTVEAYGATEYSATNLPSGLGISATSGAITGTPTILGSTVVTVTATNTNTGNSRDQDLTIEIFPTIPGAVEELDPNISWSTSGDADWFAQSDTAQSAVYAMQSGDIGDGELTLLEANFTVQGKQQLSFWWKTDSELNFDILEFRIDGIIHEIRSGDTAWAQQSDIEIDEGNHNISWEYSKDVSQSDGSDTAWVDQISLNYKLGAPGNFTATDGAIYDRVRLTWDSIPFATSYRVYRHTSDDLAAAGEIGSSSGLNYDDTSAIPGTTYHYWVRAYSASNLLGAPDSHDTGTITPDLPLSITSISHTEAGSGATITVTGTNLNHLQRAEIGGIEMAFTVVDASTVTVELPSGFQTGRITLINNASTKSSDVITKIESFQEWIENQAVAAGATFVPGSVATLSQRDDDNDSISNGMEFALGLNPYEGHLNGSAAEIDFSQNPPVFRFDAAIKHLTYEVQSSTTMNSGSWVTRSTVQQQTGTIETPIDPSWEDGGKVFMRVVATGFY